MYTGQFSTNYGDLVSFQLVEMKLNRYSEAIPELKNTLK